LRTRASFLSPPLFWHEIFFTTALSAPVPDGQSFFASTGFCPRTPSILNLLLMSISRVRLVALPTWRSSIYGWCNPPSFSDPLFLPSPSVFQRLRSEKDQLTLFPFLFKSVARLPCDFVRAFVFLSSSFCWFGHPKRVHRILWAGPRLPFFFTVWFLRFFF